MHILHNTHSACIVCVVAKDPNAAAPAKCYLVSHKPVTILIANRTSVQINTLLKNVSKTKILCSQSGLDFCVVVYLFVYFKCNDTNKYGSHRKNFSYSQSSSWSSG